MLGILISGAVQAQPSSAAQAAFRLCNARTFVAVNIARSYLHDETRNKEVVLGAVKDHPWGRALAQQLFRRDDAGQLKHPAEFAADVLYQCAITEGLSVGAPKNVAQVCLARSDIAYYLHGDRAQGLVQQEAVSRATARLVPREVYPTALVNAVADAVYAPKELPELRAISERMLWACIKSAPPTPASAASR
jgi:hypothetical protein